MKYLTCQYCGWQSCNDENSSHCPNCKKEGYFNEEDGEITESDIKEIKDMANMYKAEFGEDNRYEQIKIIITKLTKQKGK